MILEIDFNSDEAIYMQLRNQIIAAIACAELCSGDMLPSVRSLADSVGINMHTVNKTYTLLKQEGYVKLDRRKGAVIAVDLRREADRELIYGDLCRILAGALCKGFKRDEIHAMVDKIFDNYENPDKEV
ncbi:MAG: GntR family transcriptional regulator [Lachnospiraceae bacterium]|nr:GntR family transcriptional regulator [Lachnospiraceae bacterium]